MLRAIGFRILLAAILAAPAFTATSDNLVTTEAGVVEGKSAGSIRAFLGIPYGAPPVGDLRWKPPLPAPKWTGIREATGFGSRCIQARVYDDMVFRDPGMSEDCLSLNVWTPARIAAEKLPVMVWIHGGGFVAGGSSEPRQDGEHLARNGVVVVSMNYRLGFLGFLSLAELAKESGHGSAGDYGLLDQVAALRWVQRNIAAFGGDPSNVTIFGESAGSFSVSTLMASPLATGLFQKAIGESGAAFFSKDLKFESLAEREVEDSEEISERLGPQTLAQLRALPPDKLLQAFSPPGVEDSHFTPDVDGYFLTKAVPAIFASGKQNDVPLLAGWNHDEGSFELISEKQRPSAESMQALGEKEFGPNAAEFVRLYRATSVADALRCTEDFAGDKSIAFSTWSWIEAQSATGKQPIYRYRFDRVPPLDSKLPSLGAYHSAEIEYVFGQLDSKDHVNWQSDDRKLSAMIQLYWTNFARTGKPDGPGLPKWSVYSSHNGWKLMFLDGKKSKAHKDVLRPRYLFLQEEWGK